MSMGVVEVVQWGIEMLKGGGVVEAAIRRPWCWLLLLFFGAVGALVAIHCPHSSCICSLIVGNDIVEQKNK